MQMKLGPYMPPPQLRTQPLAILRKHNIGQACTDS